MPLTSDKLKNIKENVPEGPVYTVDTKIILAGNDPYVYKWRNNVYSKQVPILKALAGYELYGTLIPLTLMETLCSDGELFKEKLETLEKIKDKVKATEAPEEVKTRGIFITDEGKVLYATNFNNDGQLKELEF